MFVTVSYGFLGWCHGLTGSLSTPPEMRTKKKASKSNQSGNRPVIKLVLVAQFCISRACHFNFHLFVSALVAFFSLLL
jgi:hypothetical protein